MSTVLEDSLGVILDNVADAIEGGNTYRGSGTAYAGIPGTRSHDERVGTTVTADSGATTTAVPAKSADDGLYASLVRVDGPPFFLLGTSGANDGWARKITSYNPTSDTLTVGKAFGSAPVENDLFTVLEGFKRAPDNWNLEGAGIDATKSWDRYFSVAALPGTRLPWYGNGVQQFETQLEVRLRLLKRNRDRRAKASALENIARFRMVLTRGDHRDGLYMQILEASSQAPDLVVEDADKVIVSDRYRLIYRATSHFV